MGNVTLPTPVLVAGGVLAVAGGYLIGVVTGPGQPQRTTATVSSFERTTGRLCLSGDAVEDQAGADGKKLCGTWRRGSTAVTQDPTKGDSFRFVSLVSRDDRGSEPTTVIYGDVVG